jgi:hypothetical protein
MRNEHGQPIYNLYLEERGTGYYIHMPDELGVLPAHYAKRTTGMLMSWPVNPHFTGKTGIIEELHRIERFAAVPFS